MGKEAKNGFLLLTKHGLNKPMDKTKHLVSNWGREKRRERGEEQKERRIGRGRGRREEEEEEGKRKKRSQAPKMYGTTWAFKAWNCFPYNCIVISLFPKT